MNREELLAKIEAKERERLEALDTDDLLDEASDYLEEHNITRSYSEDIEKATEEMGRDLLDAYMLERSKESDEQLNAILAKGNGVCEICHKLEDQFGNCGCTNNDSR